MVLKPLQTLAAFGVPVSTVELKAIRAMSNKAWVLGDDRFCARIEELTGRRAKPLRRTQPGGTGADV
jgi:putative transposase